MRERGREGRKREAEEKGGKEKEEEGEKGKGRERREEKRARKKPEESGLGWFVRKRVFTLNCH